MKIMVTRRWIYYKNKPVETYSSSMIRVLREMGHKVVDLPKNPYCEYNDIDLLIDIDCGRDENGKLVWQGELGKIPIPSAVMFIDSHGYPDIHRRMAKNYDHIFFAVWDKRDLFTDHTSAHWCPNFTDDKWFDATKYTPVVPIYDFGFFGSKGGLSRAEPMIKIASKMGYTATARQIAIGSKHRWPATAEAMNECEHLFNHGQKHDGPNLRVMESMLMHRPLITDSDPRSGMDKLFEAYTHYIPYEAYSYRGLEEAMKWVFDHPDEAANIADNAYRLVKEKHLVKNRLEQILEVVNK